MILATVAADSGSAGFVDSRGAGRTRVGVSVGCARSPVASAAKEISEERGFMEESDIAAES